MKQYHIEYHKLDSGAIRLKQDTYGGDDVVDLHPLQLRSIAEHFGLVAPQPHADELTKRLAEQLCDAYLALAGEECYWSPGLASLWDRLDAQVACLPSELFPHHLWDRRQEIESNIKEAKEASAAVCQQSQCCEQEAGNAERPANPGSAVSGLQIGLGF